MILTNSKQSWKVLLLPFHLTLFLIHLSPNGNHGVFGLTSLLPPSLPPPPCQGRSLSLRIPNRHVLKTPYSSCSYNNPSSYRISTMFSSTDAEEDPPPPPTTTTTSEEETTIGRWPCNDDLDKKIISVSLPCIANYAINPLVGAVDLFWVGRMGNALAIAGQSAANQVFSSTFWLAAYLPSSKYLHFLFFVWT